MVVAQIRSELAPHREQLWVEGGGIVESVQHRNQVQVLRQIHHRQVASHPERDCRQEQAKGVNPPRPKSCRKPRGGYVHSNIRCRGFSAAC